MSGIANPRGPLPSSVYWRRRALLVVLSFALIFGISRLFSGSDDTTTTTSTPTSTPSSTPSGSVLPSPSVPPTTTAAAPVIPTGECEAENLTIESAVKNPRGGGDVEFTLAFKTRDGSNCTFAVSARTVAIRLTSGEDFIWSSQDCPRAIVPTDIVASSSSPGTMTLLWNGRRSDQGCGRLSSWALPGYYHIEAAALGGDPTDLQFELKRPAKQTTVLRPFSPEARALAEERERMREEATQEQTLPSEE